MVEFKIISRGAGLVKWMAEGWYDESYFFGLLDHTPEPLLDGRDLERLREFLRTVPALDERRTNKQRAEAHELVALIQASTADALVQEAKALLSNRVAGKSFRAVGRPRASVRLPSTLKDAKWQIAVELEHAIRERLRAGLPLEIPGWGAVTEGPGTEGLPLAERSIELTHQSMLNRGFSLPSPRRLQNEISRRRLRASGFYRDGKAQT